MDQDATCRLLMPKSNARRQEFVGGLRFVFWGTIGSIAVSIGAALVTLAVSYAWFSDLYRSDPQHDNVDFYFSLLDKVAVGQIVFLLAAAMVCLLGKVRCGYSPIEGAARFAFRMSLGLSCLILVFAIEAALDNFFADGEFGESVLQSFARTDIGAVIWWISGLLGDIPWVACVWTEVALFAYFLRAVAREYGSSMSVACTGVTLKISVVALIVHLAGAFAQVSLFSFHTSGTPLDGWPRGGIAKFSLIITATTYILYLASLRLLITSVGESAKVSTNLPSTNRTAAQ